MSQPGDNFGPGGGYQIPDETLGELREQMDWHSARTAQYSADRDLLDPEDALRLCLESLTVAHAQARMAVEWTLIRAEHVNGQTGNGV